ncbi:MAG: methyltransferase domain-containing protein [Nitrososphaeraceae archaeon]
MAYSKVQVSTNSLIILPRYGLEMNRQDPKQNAIDQNKIQQFMNKAVGDIAGGSTAMLVIIGERLGLYKAMSQANSPISVKELADKTGTVERLVSEWLANQVASGYIEYDPSSRKYRLPPEHALALADEDSPLYLQGIFKAIKSYFKDEEEFLKMFRGERTFSWMDHNPFMAEGFAEFFKSGYIGNLINSWIPAVDNGRVLEKLKKGAKVADVGCGFGITTLMMAKTYPNSTFTGFDFHKESIEKAKESAKKENITNVRFEVSSASEFPGSGYDFVTFFDCLHDMGDPIGALTHTRKVIKKSGSGSGTCMIVEPFAQNELENNVNPIGSIFYAASTLICVPNSLAFNGPALGAQAGENRIKDVALKSGFSHFKKALETPLNLVYEAKP